MNRHLPLVASSRLNLGSPTDDDLLKVAQTLLDILRHFEEESVSELWLVAQPSPEVIRCPNGDSDRISDRLSRHPTPHRPRDCRTPFGVRLHSTMQVSHLAVHVSIADKRGSVICYSETFFVDQ